MNSGFGSAPSAIGAQGADALQSVDEGGQEVEGLSPRCTARGTDTQDVWNCRLAVARQVTTPLARARLNDR